MGNRARQGLTSRLVVAAIMAALAVPGGLGCGDDAPAKKATKPAAKKASKAKRKTGKGGEPVKMLTKVEDIVTDPEEAKRIRHRFVTADFDPDPVGDESRDPFRSYVVIQALSRQGEGGLTVATTEVCTEKNMVAPSPRAKDPRARQSYSLRDLRLAGIVLRGTKSYALFRDSGGFGHHVKRGDCLGKEKAKVVKIGAGFVRLEVIPDPLPNQPAREPQKREIQLHPEELQIDEDEFTEQSPAQPRSQ